MYIFLVKFNTRQRKILKDIWSNKTRTILVILSIAVGVAAVGMVTNSWFIVERDLYTPYLVTNPHTVYMHVSPFSEDLASAVEDLREIESASARRVLFGTVFSNEDQKLDIELNVVPNFIDLRVDQYILESGTASPGLREIILERRSTERLGVSLGDTVTIELRNEDSYELIVSGIVHDMNKIPPVFWGQMYGYMKMETLQWMGEFPYYNRLDVIVAENKTNMKHVIAVTGNVRKRVVEPSGYTFRKIAFSSIPTSKPGEYWAQDQLKGLSVVLQSMSVMCILLSAGLVVNTISAIIAQQVKQIGIMRSIGASRMQIVRMYLINVLIFSVLALIIAIPLGLLGSWWLAGFIAGYLNFDLTRLTMPLHIILLEIVLGLVVPLGAALYPILNGNRISVYDAIYRQGISGVWRRRKIEKKISRLPRPFLLALRNTFRKKSRLVLTLITLTLAAGMFIAVFSTRASLNRQIEETLRYVMFDVSISMSGSTNIHTAEREALRVPGVVLVEGWGSANGFIIHSDGTEGEELDILAPPDQATTIEAQINNGRWLQPSDTWQVVVNEDLLDEEPEIRIGSELLIEINGIGRHYEVVGIVSRHIRSPVVYMNYGHFSKLTGRQNMIDELRIQTVPDEIDGNVSPREITKKLEERFDNAGLSYTIIETRQERLDKITNIFDIILIFLVFMAALLAIVGGLGLAGAMSINVLERTREIGVLRAVGASNRSVRWIVMVEGLVVGLISWIFGLIVSIPMGIGLSNAVGMAIFETVPPFRFSFSGMVVWLLLTLVIAIVATIAPAQRAAGLTVREVLAYE